MERTIISWNITNWITVLIMVAIGYAVIGALVSVGRQFIPGMGIQSGQASPGSN
jgi:hypothetical protein